MTSTPLLKKIKYLFLAIAGTYIFSSAALAGGWPLLQQQTQKAINTQAVAIPNLNLPAQGASPKVIATFPTQNALDISPDTTISINIDKYVDKNTIGKSFSLYPKGTGTLLPTNLIDSFPQGNGFVYLFQPASPLMSGMTYQAVLNNVTNNTLELKPVRMDVSSGRPAPSENLVQLNKSTNPLAKTEDLAKKFQYGWSFTTSKAPWVSKVTPGGAQVSGKIVPNLEIGASNFIITFTKDIDISSLVEALSINGQPVPKENISAWLGRPSEALIKTEPFEEGKNYQIKISPKAKDLEGLSFSNTYQVSFFTPFKIEEKPDPAAPLPYFGYLTWKGDVLNSKKENWHNCPNQNPNQACFSGAKSGGSLRTLMCPKDYIMTGFWYDVHKGINMLDILKITCSRVLIHSGKIDYSMRAYTDSVGSPYIEEGFPTAPPPPNFIESNEEACTLLGTKPAAAITSMRINFGTGGEETHNRLFSLRPICSLLQNTSPFVDTSTTEGKDNEFHWWGEGAGGADQPFDTNTILVPPGKAIVGINVYAGADIDGLDSVFAVDLDEE